MPSWPPNTYSRRPSSVHAPAAPAHTGTQMMMHASEDVYQRGGEGETQQGIKNATFRNCAMGGGGAGNEQCWAVDGSDTSQGTRSESLREHLHLEHLPHAASPSPPQGPPSPRSPLIRLLGPPTSPPRRTSPGRGHGAKGADMAPLPALLVVHPHVIEQHAVGRAAAKHKDLFADAAGRVATARQRPLVALDLKGAAQRIHGGGRGAPCGCACVCACVRTHARARLCVCVCVHVCVDAHAHVCRVGVGARMGRVEGGGDFGHLVCW